MTHCSFVGDCRSYLLPLRRTRRAAALAEVESSKGLSRATRALLRGNRSGRSIKSASATATTVEVK